MCVQPVDDNVRFSSLSLLYEIHLWNGDCAVYLLETYKCAVLGGYSIMFVSFFCSRTPLSVRWIIRASIKCPVHRKNASIYCKVYIKLQRSEYYID